MSRQLAVHDDIHKYSMGTTKKVLRLMKCFLQFEKWNLENSRAVDGESRIIFIDLNDGQRERCAER